VAISTNDPIGNLFEDVTLEINFKASVKLAQKAKKAGIKKFTFASSCSMYGAAEDRTRNETSPLNLLTAYARSKVHTEGELKGIGRGRISGQLFTFFYGLRVERPAAAGSGIERFYGLWGNFRRNNDSERRDALEAADQRARHSPGDRMGDCQERQRWRFLSGGKCGQRRVELPGKGPGPECMKIA
jgi:nucleoside-diphosphate-sugar epimerase